ncbi:MAG: hypothetical protein ACXWT4_14360 [Methylobacter sp.]
MRDIEIDAFLTTRAQGFGNRCIGGQQCFALARPVQLVALLRAFDDRTGELLFQQVKINRPFDLALRIAIFSDAVGKQFRQFGDVGFGKIRSV